MMTLAAFCAQAGIDETAARRALAARTAHDDAPWYMQAVLGIGAWITAIAALFFAWAVMDLVLGIDEPNLAVAICGALVFAGSVWLLQHRPAGAFTAHAAVALATAGTLLGAAGIGVPSESVWAAAAACLPFAVVAIWQQRSLLLQFLVVSATLILAILAMWDDWDEAMPDLPALFIPAGVALLLYPPRRDVRPAAFALLLVPQLLSLVSWELVSGAEAPWSAWLAKGLFLVVLAYLVVFNWTRAPEARGRILAMAPAAIIAVVVGVLLPTGAAAALVLMALAYTVGSRSLAAIGALMEVYFIWLYYWDLQQTLLTKSIILMAVGAVLLVGYGLLARTLRARRAS